MTVPQVSVSPYVRQRLVGEPPPRAVHGQAAAQTEGERDRAVGEFGSGAPPGLVHESGAGTGLDGGPQYLSGVGAPGRHAPAGAAAHPVLGAQGVVALEAARGQQHPAPGPHPDRAVRRPRLDSGHPALLRDQPGHPVAGADPGVPGPGGGQQQAADEGAARAQRCVGVAPAGAVPVDRRAYQGQQFTQQLGCQVERYEGAPGVHPAGGREVVGEGAPLESDGGVGLQPGHQFGGVPQEGLPALRLRVTGQGPQVAARRLGGVVETGPLLHLGAGQPAGRPGVGGGAAEQRRPFQYDGVEALPGGRQRPGQRSRAGPDDDHVVGGVPFLPAVPHGVPLLPLGGVGPSRPAPGRRARGRSR